MEKEEEKRDDDEGEEMETGGPEEATQQNPVEEATHRDQLLSCVERGSRVHPSFGSIGVLVVLIVIALLWRGKLDVVDVASDLTGALDVASSTTNNTPATSRPPSFAFAFKPQATTQPSIASTLAPKAQLSTTNPAPSAQPSHESLHTTDGTPRASTTLATTTSPTRRHCKVDDLEWVPVSATNVQLSPKSTSSHVRRGFSYRLPILGTGIVSGRGP